MSNKMKYQILKQKMKMGQKINWHHLKWIQNSKLKDYIFKQKNTIGTIKNRIN